MTVDDVRQPADHAGLAVATRGLVKHYGKQPALAGLDMSVPRGKVYGFLGPNGSGKTTTLRLLVGLLRPQAGRMWLLGEPYTWRDRKRLYSVGALIETPAFYPYLSGRDNLKVIGAAGPPTAAKRVDEVLDYVGLHDRAGSAVKTYSLGMKQRLGVAAAMLNDPELLILDEPANGLDPGGMVALRETLRWLTSKGRTVLISSHMLSEVEQMADVVGIIGRGQLLREGPLAEVLSDSARVRIRVAPTELSQAAEVLRRLPGQPAVRAVEDQANPGWLQVDVHPGRSSEANRALADAGIYASGVDAGTDLETLFLQLTGSGDFSATAAASAGSPEQSA